MSVKSSISLSDRQAAFARSLVEQGRYSSVSAVIQNGLELLRQQTEAEEAKTAALKCLLVDRLGGDFVESAEMQTRVASMIDKKRRSLRVDG
ncbi:MAG: ribbon-helix-helix domain-containing protein [Hoeflea sp.]|uniref:ribbon-helix-helix domain-containing protein n=1 Tax=Hoeflea sp. TaxID=1940281 RepID=UPI003EF93445